MRVAIEDGRAQRWRVLLFAFLLAAHAVLILLAQRSLIRIPPAAEEPLSIFSVTAAPREVPRTAASSSASRPRAVRPLAASPPTPAAAPDAAVAPRSSLDIDWSAEAALTAQHQTDLAAAPGPRSLDDHHGRKPRAGLNSSAGDAFGWDYAATHRVETSQGLPIIHVSDRCVVGFLLILPFFGCGFGAEIPANGELFKHLHEERSSSVPTPP